MIFGCVIGGDTPEVEVFEAFCFGVKEGLAEEADGGGEVFVGGVGGGLHVVASGVFLVVEEEGSGDDLVGFDLGVFEADEIKGGEGLSEFVF